MDVFKDLLGEEIRYNLKDINDIMFKIQEGTICDIREKELRGQICYIDGQECFKRNENLEEQIKKFRASEEWNNKIKENFNCTWEELKDILYNNFAVYFYMDYFFKKMFPTDNLGFTDEHTLIKGKVVEKELNFKDKLKFNEKKITYDKNVSFRISEESYNNLKEMLLNTNQNNGEFFSNMIIKGFNKYFLEKEPEQIYIINNYKL